MMFRVSVVIPTKNRPYDLERCLKSIIAQTYPVDEIIIIDGSENDHTKKLCEIFAQKYGIAIKYIKQESGGLATARNLGNEYATGDIVFNLEDDIILDRDFVKEIVEVFKKDERGEIGGVGGIQISLNDKHYNKIRELLYTIFGLFFFRDFIRKGSVTISGHHARLPRKFSYVEWLYNAAYRKEVVKRFKYDENLERTSSFAYYDDLDFSYTVSRTYKLVLNPRAKYVHLSSFTGHYHLDIYKVASVKIQNHYYLVKKHRFSKAAFWWSTFGLLISYAVLGIKNKEHRLAFRGLIDGIKRIVTNKLPY